MIYIFSEDSYLKLGLEAILLAEYESVATIDVNINKEQLQLIKFTCEDTLILAVECISTITLLLAIARFNGTKILLIVDNVTKENISNINTWSQGVISKKSPLHLFPRVIDGGLGYIKGKPYLTVRETSVLNCLAKGKTPYYISMELKISIKTVCAHKISALRKLGLSHLNARSVLIYEKIFQGMLEN
ncbi:response regulator transcription factor [Serratia fonticola]|uniref:helix-turn-helix transcriptional regulator n=1 Tax=Serratia fonticola TaxID=47917 RepID=UPI003AAE87FE